MAEEKARKQMHARGHVHGAHCYWDYRECRWVCPAEVEDEVSSRQQAAAASAPSS